MSTSTPTTSSSSSSSTPNTLSKTSTHPKNYSILSIPAAYVLGWPPHYYIFYHAMTTASSSATNTLPRSHLDFLKGKVATSTYNTLLRARGAHLNAMEGFPLFAAAILAGNHMKLPTSDLNWAAGTYLASRVLYTALYMTTTSEVLSYARSSVYAVSVGVPFLVLWKAGMKVRDEGVAEKEL